MNKKQFFKELETTYKACLSTSRKKNHDYAGDTNPFKNFELCEYLGVCSTETGILVRICDKISRIANLLEKERQVKDEKLEDTIEDNINYLAILKAFIKSKQND